MTAVTTAIFAATIIYSGVLSGVRCDGRTGRLLSNPLGLFGHTSCVASSPSPASDSSRVSGLCYNELECLAGGGTLSGYCSPAALGVCCVFTHKNCGRTVKQKVSYFTNPNYPLEDTKPIACLLKILPAPDTCYVQLDYEDLSVPSVNGKCAYDSISILRSPEGPAGRVCGHKSGYATLTRVRAGQELGVSAVMQSAPYRWRVRVTMVSCAAVPADVPRITDCGMTGQAFTSGATRPRSLAHNSLASSGGLGGLGGTVVRKKIKRRLRTRAAEHGDSAADDFCFIPGIGNICDGRGKSSRSDGNGSSLLSSVDLRSYSSEIFRPSFSSKATFCESKFRGRGGQEASARVYDGQEAPLGSFPWLASLQYRSKHFCGGSLISEQWVLTVAHCPDFPNVANFISELKVSLGDHNLYTSTEADNLLLGVAKIINYPLYDQAGYNGDLSLLKLEAPVIFHRNIRPICLPINDIDTYEKQIGIAAGWGKTETGDLPDTLRYVELNIVPNVTCVMNLAMVNIDITDKMICTFKGPTGRETTCTGDSGGPLMVRRSGRFVLVGATSFSLVDCQSPFPNVFSRVSTFLEWISVAVKDYGSSL